MIDFDDSIVDDDDEDELDYGYDVAYAKYEYGDTTCTSHTEAQQQEYNIVSNSSSSRYYSQQQQQQEQYESSFKKSQQPKLLSSSSTLSTSSSKTTTTNGTLTNSTVSSGGGGDTKTKRRMSITAAFGLATNPMKAKNTKPNNKKDDILNMGSRSEHVRSSSKKNSSENLKNMSNNKKLPKRRMSIATFSNKLSFGSSNTNNNNKIKRNSIVGGHDSFTFNDGTIQNQRHNDSFNNSKGSDLAFNQSYNSSNGQVSFNGDDSFEYDVATPKKAKSEEFKAKTRRRLSVSGFGHGTAALFTGGNKNNEKTDDSLDKNSSHHSATTGKAKRRMSLVQVFTGGNTTSSKDKLDDIKRKRDKPWLTDANKPVGPRQGRRLSIGGLFGGGGAAAIETKNSKAVVENEVEAEKPHPFSSKRKPLTVVPGPVMSTENDSDSTLLLSHDQDSVNDFINAEKSKQRTEPAPPKIRKFEESMLNAIKLNVKKKKQRIQATVVDEIDMEYQNGLRAYGEDDYDDYDKVLANLHAATLVVQQFVNVTHSVGITGESQFGQSDEDDIKIRLIQIFYREMENYILPRLTSLYNTNENDHYNLNSSILTSDNAAELIVWYSNFLDHTKLCCPYGSASVTWRTDVARLLDYYIENNIKMAMKCFAELFVASLHDSDGNPSSSSTTMQQDTAGQVSTSWPEDVANYLRCELSMERGHLPKHVLADVFEAGAQHLLTMVTDCAANIKKYWKNISIRRYCSIINDTSRMSRLLGTVHDKYLTDYCTNSNICDPEVAIKFDGKYSALYKKAKRIEKEFVELSLQCTSHCCEKIISSVIQPTDSILDSIGCTSWEKSSSNSKADSAVRRVLKIIQTQFGNLEKWISSNYFFHKVLKECFDSLLQTYVESFYTNTMINGVKNAAHAAKQLHQDYLDLVYFFNGPIFEKLYNSSAILSEQDINSRLLIVLSMSRLVDPSQSVHDLVDDTRTILLRVSHSGDRNAGALLHLTGLRTNLTREESVTWMKIINDVEKEVLDGQTCFDENSIKLPDLRNSPYIHRVRVNKNDLNRYCEQNNNTGNIGNTSHSAHHRSSTGNDRPRPYSNHSTGFDLREHNTAAPQASMEPQKQTSWKTRIFG